MRGKTHDHSSLSQKIPVALFTFLPREQFVSRHAAPGRKVLADSRVGGAHFEHCPRFQAFHPLEHEQEEASAAPLVSAVAHGANDDLLPITSTENLS